MLGEWVIKDVQIWLKKIRFLYRRHIYAKWSKDLNNKKIKPQKFSKEKTSSGFEVKQNLFSSVLNKFLRLLLARA